MENVHKASEFNIVGRYRGKDAFAHVLMALGEWILAPFILNLRTTQG